MKIKKEPRKFDDYPVSRYIQVLIYGVLSAFASDKKGVLYSKIQKLSAY